MVYPGKREEAKRDMGVTGEKTRQGQGESDVPGLSDATGPGWVSHPEKDQEKQIKKVHGRRKQNY